MDAIEKNAFDDTNNLSNQVVAVDASNTATDINPAPPIDLIRKIIQENLPKTKGGRIAGQSKLPFKCPKCVARYKTQENLDIHSKIHDDGELRCDICNKVFKTTCALIAHKNVHDDDRPFKCTLCDMRCKHRGSLKEHLKLHKKLIFKCSICGKDFNNINNCKLHEKRHTGAHNQKKKCQICGKEFAQKCLLAYHMRTHTGEKPNVCEHCGAAFACKSNLKKHYRIHTGERPFVCDICNKGFNQKSSLTCHKRSHVTFKPFACKVCSKQFGLNEELIVHMRIHGERKMFKCNMCEFEFTEHCYLKSHYRMHTQYQQTTKKPWVYNVNVDLEDRNNYLKDGEEPRILPENGKESTLTDEVKRKKRKSNTLNNVPPKKREGQKRIKKAVVNSYKESDDDDQINDWSELAAGDNHINSDSDSDTLYVPPDDVQQLPKSETQFEPESKSMNSSDAGDTNEMKELLKTEPKIEIKTDDDEIREITAVEMVHISIKEEIDIDDGDPTPTFEEIDWKKWLEARFAKQVNYN